MSRFTKILAAVAVLGAVGLAACGDDLDEDGVEVQVNDRDLLDDDDLVDIETPEGGFEIEEDGDIQAEE